MSSKRLWHHGHRPDRWISATWRSRRICGKLTGEVFFGALLLRAKEGKGQGNEGDMVMPAEPASALKVIEAEFLLEFAIILLDGQRPLAWRTALRRDGVGWPSGRPSSQ